MQLLEDPELTETKDGSKILDTLAFSGAMNRRLADAESKLEQIVHSDELGRPRLDKFYARHVMDAIWTAKGKLTGREVKDLTPAANIRFVAA